MFKRILHIGIVVADLQRAIDRFRGFGLPCSEVKVIEGANLQVAFFPVGNSFIELLSPVDPNERRALSSQSTIDHICFEVDDLEASIRNFLEHGARLQEGFPRKGAHGRIAFFDPKTTEGILIELCEL